MTKTPREKQPEEEAPAPPPDLLVFRKGANPRPRRSWWVVLIPIVAIGILIGLAVLFG